MCSLFNFVTLLESVNICCNFLYRSYFFPPGITEKVFFEVMKFATIYFEFTFDNFMYRQINGLPWVPLWALHWRIYLLVFMRGDCFVYHFVFYYIIGIWTILSFYSMMRINFSTFSIVFIQHRGLRLRKSPILNWYSWVY